MQHGQRILVVMDDPGWGGVFQFTHALVCGLVRAGYEVNVVHPSASGPLMDEQAHLGVRHLWLDYNPVVDFHRTVKDAESARRFVASARPDLVLHSDSCPISNFAMKRVALESGKPYLCVEQFVAPYLAQRFAELMPLLGEVYDRASEVVAVSQENLGLLRRHFELRPGKGCVIHYGRPASYFAPRDIDARRRLRNEQEIPEGALVCFTAARLETVKGFQYQIHAMQMLARTVHWRDLYFVWAGSGSLESELRAALSRLELADHVRLVGQRDDIVCWLDASDVFLLPSVTEGMPISVMEAMAKGLPVAASAVSGIPEELGDTGKLLPSPNLDPRATVAALVDTLQAWVSDAALRERIGAACRTHAQLMFREDRMISDYLQLVQRTLAPGGCGGV